MKIFRILVLIMLKCAQIYSNLGKVQGQGLSGFYALRSCLNVVEISNISTLAATIQIQTK